MSATELDTDTADLVRRLAELNTHITDLTEQTEQIKEKLRANLNIGTYTINNQPAISIKPTRRFSPTRALTVLPVELLLLCQISVIDAKKAREVLPPALYASCQEDTGKPQVRLV